MEILQLAVASRCFAWEGSRTNHGKYGFPQTCSLVTGTCVFRPLGARRACGQTSNVSGQKRNVSGISGIPALSFFPKFPECSKTLPTCGCSPAVDIYTPFGPNNYAFLGNPEFPCFFVRKPSRGNARDTKTANIRAACGKPPQHAWTCWNRLARYSSDPWSYTQIGPPGGVS